MNDAGDFATSVSTLERLIERYESKIAEIKSELAGTWQSEVDMSRLEKLLGKQVGNVVERVEEKEDEDEKYIKSRREVPKQPRDHQESANVFAPFKVVVDRILMLREDCKQLSNVEYLKGDVSHPSTPQDIFAKCSGMLRGLSEASAEIDRAGRDLEMPKETTGDFRRCMELNKKCIIAMSSMLKENIDMRIKCNDLESSLMDRTMEKAKLFDKHFAATDAEEEAAMVEAASQHRRNEKGSKNAFASCVGASR